MNCSSHIVTRFTEAEVEQTFATVRAKIDDLQAENARLRRALSARADTDIATGGDR